jgi:hypothetical protein
VLGLPMSKLFSQYDQQDGSALLVKADQGMEVVRRGTEKATPTICSTTRAGRRRASRRTW